MTTFTHSCGRTESPEPGSALERVLSEHRDWSSDGDDEQVETPDLASLDEAGLAAALDSLSVVDVLDAVATDAELAGRVLDAERTRAKPRKGVVAGLQAISQ